MSKIATAKTSIKKTALLKRLSPIIVVVVVALIGVTLIVKSAAASTNVVYLSPASATVTLGNTITVALRENSSTTPLIGVDATITYPANLLEFVSADTSGPFTIAPPDSAGAGSVEIVRGSTAGLTDDQLVANLTFKTLAAGTASLSFSPASHVTDTNNNSVPMSYSGGTYTISKTTVKNTGKGSGRKH